MYSLSRFWWIPYLCGIIAGIFLTLIINVFAGVIAAVVTWFAVCLMGKSEEDILKKKAEAGDNEAQRKLDEIAAEKKKKMQEKVYKNKKEEAKDKWKAIMNKEIPLEDILADFELLFHQWSDVTLYSPIVWIGRGKLSKTKYRYGEAVNYCFTELQKLYPEDNRIPQYWKRWEKVTKYKRLVSSRNHVKMINEQYVTICPKCGNRMNGMQNTCYDCGKNLGFKHVEYTHVANGPKCVICGKTWCTHQPWEKEAFEEGMRK